MPCYGKVYHPVLLDSVHGIGFPGHLLGVMGLFDYLGM